jgi:hypothetical protein
VVTLECPVCNRIIPIPLQKSADEVIGDHINEGCAPLESIRPFKCAVKSCKAKMIQNTACKLCNRLVCLNHRYPDQHACLKLKNTRNLPMISVKG